MLDVTGMRHSAPTCMSHGVLLTLVSLGLQEGEEPGQAQAVATCCSPHPGLLPGAAPTRAATLQGRQ